MRHLVSSPSFDCIIIGGGHAGAEAALAAAKLGCATLLLTSNIDHIGQLSCNPAIGGLAKGHMVRELDALGGMMGLWADEAAIQFRMLNASKGPAVRAPRAQVDREVYRSAVQRDLFACPNLQIRQDMASALIVEKGRVAGVRTFLGQEFKARAICLTSGTFLNGMLHLGEHHFPGGRLGDESAAELSESLRAQGIRLRRFMTCTPPRVLAHSVDFSAMEEQPGDPMPQGFSFRGPGVSLPQVSCYLTWTNLKTHEIISAALGRSPMYNGAIPGPGPRYCPAIEDKIARFPEKNRHQIFVEPEGVDAPQWYVNNIPTGLPLDVQQAILASIPGLEKAVISRPGYAIEYDAADSTQLFPNLESKVLPGLWLAGQVNGTSGYEEAAAQGLLAGINMVRALRDQPPFVLGRDAAHMGVLADDLVTRGTDEPYRMFTSRSEHRLLLREGNADLRLTPAGRELGLVDDACWALFAVKKEALSALTAMLLNHRVTPDASTRERFSAMGEAPPNNALSLADLLRRPGFDCQKISVFCPELMAFSEPVRLEAETTLRYEGYLARQEELAAKSAQKENTPLPRNLDYAAVAGLTSEAAERLLAIQPRTLGQAGRMAGITPAALVCLDVHIRKLARAK